MTYDPTAGLPRAPGLTIERYEEEDARAHNGDAAASSAAMLPAHSEEALALQFTAEHENRIRYCAAWSKWLLWDGSRWIADERLATFDMVRELCRRSAKTMSKSKAAALCRAATVAAVDKLCRADQRTAATADQWDGDTALLNTTSGIVNFKEAQMRQHDPLLYLTKQTAVAPDCNCPIPLWLAFLDRITGGDQDLQSFLQRVAGYCLTGDTSEHALFFLHGSGSNGKSVFISTLAGILGDYHRTAPIETFTESHSDRHPTELAMLRGARLVTAIETEEGRRWAESKIKALTGGDKISARFMRQDFFEFVPQFKLLIAGNHKPSLRSVDEAIRRRFHLIPFSVTIPPEERDLHFGEKLKAEWPGILAWAVDGCFAWQSEGLNPPPAVVSATDAYLTGEDAIAVWLDECCERSPSSWTASGALYGCWRTWADHAGEQPGTIKRFAQKLETHGFNPERRMTGRGFSGLRIQDP